MDYDVVVIGAGHAGVEAALSSARLGLKTALVNFYDDKVATMPCNPSIGGPAKGIVVREIDALGGQMAKSADKTSIQMKLLNSSRGPGVWALRAQIDKIEYSKYMKSVIEEQENLDFIIGSFQDAKIVGDKVTEIKLESGIIISTKSLIITTGTYSNSSILIGSDSKKEGPSGEKTTPYITQFLKKIGLNSFRFKTGTPPRVLRESIDLTKAKIEAGTEGDFSFSFSTNEFKNINNQEDCYLIHSTIETKSIVEKNLNKSAMYSGKKIANGPRYCPSFEDKIVRFSNKDTHQIFLEPESLSMNTLYVQGFSTSMPIDIQEKMLKSLPGFENVIVEKWAYAIEYDCIDPMQLSPSLSSKKIKNLFFAGQINGTSGYEEAAAQGLIAGINASMYILKKEPLILKRNQAYIGVMIDDLVNKGVNEPYRLLTSRAEYRLSLRNDNAERRLKAIGKEIGLINNEDWNKYQNYINNINQAVDFLLDKRIKPKDNFSDILFKENKITISSGISLYELLKQPRIDYNIIFNYFDELKDLTTNQINDILINSRFEGYIKKEDELVEKMIKQENKMIPKDIDYDNVENIASEARIYLKKVRPTSIGQASRVRGVNPADIQMLLFYMKNKYSSN